MSYRALFVHSANEMYGADRILFDLIRSRDAAKWEAKVIVPNDVPYNGLLQQRLNEIGVESDAIRLAVLRRRYFTPKGFPLYCVNFARSVIRLVNEIRRGRVDIVHSNTTAVIPGAIAAKLTNRPHIWHSHEMIISPSVVRKMTARLAPALSDTVVTVSSAVKDHILKDNPSAKNIRVIHNGIDVQKFASASGRERIRSEFGISPSDVLVGALGRISKGKGQVYLVEALAAASSANLKCLIVGEPFVGQEVVLEELNGRIKALGLQDRVIISGYRQDAPDIYAALDIYALPSTLPDSFPTVVLEAMAAGKPVIATNWGGAVEMVEDGVTGFIVPTDDVDLLASKIGWLASDPECRLSMGQKGQLRVHELFSISRMASNFWRLMDETLAARRSG